MKLGCRVQVFERRDKKALSRLQDRVPHRHIEVRDHAVGRLTKVERQENISFPWSLILYFGVINEFLSRDENVLLVKIILPFQKVVEV